MQIVKLRETLIIALFDTTYMYPLGQCGTRHGHEALVKMDESNVVNINAQSTLNEAVRSKAFG